MKPVNYELYMSVATFPVDFDTIHGTTQKGSLEKLPKEVVANFTQ